MKHIFVILVLVISMFFGCSTDEKKVFPPFTLDNVSKDSMVLKVTYDEFLTEFNERKRYQKIISKGEFSKHNEESLYSKTFLSLVLNKKLKHEYDYLGIQVTDKEIEDFTYGKNIDEQISSMPVFRNPRTKQFDKTLIKPFIEKLSKDKSSEPYFIWNQHVNSIKEGLLRKKYESLLQFSQITTKTANEWHNKLSVGESSLKVFSVPYNMYYDSINPTDDDFLDLIKDKSYDYQISDKRYIRVANIPAKIHKHFHEKEYNALSRYLETVKDFDEIAKQNDIIKTFSSYYTENTLPEDLQSFFTKGKAGDTYGPYFVNNSFRILKINAIDNMPTEANAQHLVIKNVSKEKIESIKKDIEVKVDNGESFLELSKSYAAKYGPDGKWGDLGWFTYGEMVDDFSDSVFMNKPGKIVLAQSQYGWHIISIVDHKNISKKYNFSALYWPLQPVEEDFKSTIQEAKEFIGSLESHKDFESKASERGYPMEEYQAFAYNQAFVDFENSAEVYNWAYNAFENEIKTFRINDKIYAIKLYKIAPPGLMPVFDAREFVRNGVQNRLVKEYLKENLDADKINNMSIEDAAKHFKAPIYIIKGVKFTDVTAPRVGTDPYIVGLMTAIEPGEKSKIAYGGQRIYMFEKLSENNKQLTTIVGKNKLKEWKTNIINGRYQYAFKRNDRLSINLPRKQDSYFLVSKYEKNLPNNLDIANQMYDAERAFRNKDYENALNGTQQYKGFASLIDNAKGSKQHRLLLIYAGLSALQIGEYEKVIEYMSELETEDRFFSIVKYGAMGDAYSELGDDDKALDLYLKADKANNNFVIAPEYLMKAVAIYDKKGEYKKALETYRLFETKHGPTRHNFDTGKYIAHYEFMSNKSQIVVSK